MKQVLKYILSLVLVFSVFSVNINASAKTITYNEASNVNYTVEFTYGDQQFIINGGDTVLLRDILNNLGLKGEVTSYRVSNDKLFNVFIGDENGILYEEKLKFIDRETHFLGMMPINKANAKIKYITAMQSFNTDEWLDVVIDGREYRIIVTDEIITAEGTVSTPDANLPNISQGKGNTFASDIPVGTIWIDGSSSSGVAMSIDSRNRATFIPGTVFNNNPGFVKRDVGTGNASGYSGKNTIEYDFSLQPFTEDDNYVVSGNYGTFYKRFDGVLGTFKWENVALIMNASGQAEYCDVYIEYSDLLLPIGSEDTAVINNKKIDDGTIGLMSANAIQLGNSSNIRYGVEIKVRPYIKDKNGNLVDGNFYFPMVDLDVNRGTLNDILYGSTDKYRYSEQVVIKDGLESNIFIPGATGDTRNYISNIDYDSTDGSYLFRPSISGTSESNDNSTFYSGFIVLVKNGDFSLTFRGSSGNRITQMESYILAGTAFNHKLKHSTGIGGTIQTTKDGNHSGELNDGSDLIDPTIIATATGQTVTYTFKPQPGYRLKEVKVKNGSIDYTSGSVVTNYSSFDDNGDGITDRYTYTFSGINKDNAIHVEWEALRLSVHKKTTGTGAVDDTFTFEISATDGTNYVDFSTITGKTFTSKGNNKYEFTLNSDETFDLPIGLIPYGYTWEIKETGLGNLSGWSVVGSDTQSAQIDYNQKAEFINSRGGYNINVEKIWEDDDESIRPDSLMIHITKKDSNLKTGPQLRQLMYQLASCSTTTMSNGCSAISSFKRANKAEYEAAQNNELTIQTASVSGDAATYMWFEGNTIYYYSEANNVILNKNSSQMFEGMKNLVNVSGLENINASFAENMFAMFRDCLKLTDITPLQKWNVGNVTSMRYMFASNNLPNNRMTLSNITPLQKWNTQSVTDMASLFRGTDIVDITPIKNWNVSNVANMNAMFFRTKITSASAIVDWDVVRVGKTYVNASNNNNATGDFKQMFQHAPVASVTSNLPVFTNRAGSWTSNSGDYSTSISPETDSANVKLNTVNTTNSYVLTQPVSKNKNIWIYELNVDTGAYLWDVYEDVPANYTVSDGTTNGKGSVNDPITNVAPKDTAHLHNKRNTKEITLKKNWVDNNDQKNLRPNNLEGFIKYKIGEKEVTLNSGTWVKTGNTWTYKFKVPVEATISDWGENSVPTNYSFKKESYVGSDVYEMTNTLTDLKLTIEKKVTGNMADSNQKFKFTIKIKDNLGNSLQSISIQNGTSAYVTLDATANGFEIELKHGESVVISSLAANYTYEISENAEGYSPSYKIMEGTVTKASGTTADIGVTTLTNNQVVTFVNNREQTPQTGAFTTILPYILLMLITLFGTIIMQIKLRKF